MSIHPDVIRTGLEARFNHILQTRMADVPVINPSLRVQAVSFQHWGECALGVLVTPWFMNLMLVSCEGDGFDDLRVGAKQIHTFSSGSYEFVVGYEDGIGRYQSCSLFSPMFEFASHDHAVAVAEAVLKALMDEANVDESGWSRADEIRNQWLDNAPAEPSQEDLEPMGRSGNDDLTPPPTLQEKLEAPLSRRDLFRGKLFGASNPSNDHDQP